MYKEDKRACKVYGVFIAIVVIAALSGCVGGKLNLSSIDNWFNTNQDSLKTKVQLTTYGFLKLQPKLVPTFNTVIPKLQKAISDGTVTNAGLIETFLDNELAKQNIEPALLIILNDPKEGFTKQIKQAVLDTFTTLNLSDPTNQLVEVNKILGWSLEISSVMK